MSYISSVPINPIGADANTVERILMNLPDGTRLSAEHGTSVFTKQGNQITSDNKLHMPLWDFACWITRERGSQAVKSHAVFVVGESE